MKGLFDNLQRGELFEFRYRDGEFSFVRVATGFESESRFLAGVIVHIKKEDLESIYFFARDVVSAIVTDAVNLSLEFIGAYDSAGNLLESATTWLQCGGGVLPDSVCAVAVMRYVVVLSEEDIPLVNVES